MGIMDNIRGIREAINIRGKESSIARDALDVSTVEAKFLNEYGSFKMGLMDLLEKFIIEQGNYSLELKGKNTDANKMLKHSMSDEEINLAYNVEITASGTFRYSIGSSIEEMLREQEQVEKDKENREKDKEDDNVMYI